MFFKWTRNIACDYSYIQRIICSVLIAAYVRLYLHCWILNRRVPQFKRTPFIKTVERLVYFRSSSEMLSFLVNRWFQIPFKLFLVDCIKGCHLCWTLQNNKAGNSWDFFPVIRKRLLQCCGRQIEAMCALFCFEIY